MELSGDCRLILENLNFFLKSTTGTCLIIQPRGGRLEDGICLNRFLIIVLRVGKRSHQTSQAYRRNLR